MPKVAKKASKKVAKSVSLKKAKRARTTVATSSAAPAPSPAPVKKVAKKTVKRIAKNKAMAKTKGEPRTRKGPTMSIEFAEGTDMKTAWEAVLEGGASRAQVSERLAAIWSEHRTRNGNTKPVSTIMNHVVRRGKANGYKIEQTWKMVKDPDAQAPEPAPVAPKRIIKKTVKKVAKASKKA